MSATLGRDVIKNGLLGSQLDADGNRIINADLTDASNTLPPATLTNIPLTVDVLKGNGIGGVEAATARVHYWDTSPFNPSGVNSRVGLVPDPGGSAGSTRFLNENGNWVTPASVSVPTIASTTSVVKGDGSGNIVAATAKTDFWDTTEFVASGGSAAKGLVPAPPGSSGSTKFLCEDKTWAVPPASAGVTIANTTNVIKGDNAGGGVAATPGTDYVSPSTALTRLTAATVTLSGAAPAINWATTTSFSWTLSANASPTFSNATDSYDISLAITNTASNYTVTWPAGIKWQNGTPPTQTVGAKSDIWSFKQFGSTIYGSVHANHS